MKNGKCMVMCRPHSLTQHLTGITAGCLTFLHSRLETMRIYISIYIDIYIHLKWIWISIYSLKDKTKEYKSKLLTCSHVTEPRHMKNQQWVSSLGTSFVNQCYFAATPSNSSPVLYIRLSKRHYYDAVRAVIKT